MVGGVVSAFSRSLGKRVATKCGTPGWKTRPECAASWCATRRTVWEASSGPSVATTFVVVRCGRKRRRNQSEPPVTSSATTAAPKMPAAAAASREREKPARAASPVAMPTGHQ